MYSSADNTGFSPLVSAVVPLFNGGRYIEDCLRSILAQTYENYEIIVIDDASEDDGPEKVKKISALFPGRIRLISHPDHKNRGIAASRNLGIRNAGGDYIAFLDQDDMWLENRLKMQVEALRRYPDAALVYGRTMYIDDNGNSISVDNVYPASGKGYGKNPKNIFNKIIKENIIPTLTVLVKKSSLKDCGYFEEGPRHEYEDWLLWSKIALREKILFVPDIVSKYRFHGTNYSSFRLKSGLDTKADAHYIASILRYLEDNTDILKKYLRRYYIRLIFYFFLRARSWGAEKKELVRYKKDFINEFPDYEGVIKAAFGTALAFHPGVMQAARRIRRAVIRI